MKIRTLGVIPARYGAQRFPGKPLALIAGKPLVQRVYEQARQAKRLDDVVVATDDTRILEAVEGFGGNAVLTDPACPSGTDRAAEVARQYPCDLIVNIQGDEPLMKPGMIDQLVAGMEASPEFEMGTLARPVESTDVWANPNVVKVVFGAKGNALYFSRCPVPFVRDANGGFVTGKAHKHIGIYAYRKDFLLTFVTLPQSALEQTEKLEQLRALENGFGIRVWVTPYDSIGVDRPEDVELVEEILRKEQ
ncbi:MAG: 8-amino-3,8-dideoxy-manno-octulosonate cytidylyltransferase [Verrucomicrobiae bacterium]|nr:8-amino-3,8-dideoxy-manno-octulosonate cytidylyltransferase [Verrucomicrobiae bacterium]